LLDASLDAMHGIVEQVHLTVVADNRPAIALYERCGFRSYGLEPRSLRSPGGYADELLMVRFLTDEPRPSA
jgi:RimJ/RimL family protein N-acetyltransferase